MSNGWTLERRLRQAKIIQNWKPWKQATGPQTDEGKKRSSRNAYKDGSWLEQRELMQQLRRLLKEQKKTIDDISS